MKSSYNESRTNAPERADGRPARKKAGYGQSNAAETNADWWINNAPTRHLTNSQSLFVQFKKIESPCSVKAAEQADCEKKNYSSFVKYQAKFSKIDTERCVVC